MLTTENTLLLVIDLQERLVPVMPRPEDLAQKAATMIAGCRILDVPIVVTQQYTKGLGNTVEEIAEALEEFNPIEKVTFSCCNTEEFNDIITNAGRKNILVSGVEAHVCIQQTVQDLLERGYNVYVIADCISSRAETDLYYAEKRMEKAGAILTTMESVLFELLTRADHPKRKDISYLLK